MEPTISKKLKKLMSWQLIAFIALVAFLITTQLFISKLPLLIKALGGRQVTGYVYSRSIDQHYRGTYYILEVSFTDQNKEVHFEHINVTHAEYQKYPDKEPLAPKDPIELVYLPYAPSQVYTMTGQSLPSLGLFAMYIGVIVIVPAVIQRYRKTLMRKVF